MIATNWEKIPDNSIICRKYAIFVLADNSCKPGAADIFYLHVELDFNSNITNLRMISNYGAQALLIKEMVGY